MLLNNLNDLAHSDARNVCVAATPAITIAMTEGTFVDSNPKLISIPNQAFGQISVKSIPDKTPTQTKMNKADNIAVKYFIK